MNDNWQQLDHLIVTRRLPNEKNDIKEFVRPSDVAVREVYESQHLSSVSDRDKVVALLSWVCQNIKYPKDESISRLIAFDGYGVRIKDYWQFPAETLAGPRIGDCDSCSNLLASLIRNFASPKDVYVVLGGYKSDTMNHAWVEWNDLILEPTKDALPSQVFEHSGNYKAMVRYNDKEIWVKGRSANYEWLQDVGSGQLDTPHLVRNGQSQAIAYPPMTDTERAMNHYGITKEEYALHPWRYPLPDRGSAHLVGSGSSHALIDSAAYQDMALYPEIELGEFRIVEVPSPTLLFRAIEDEVARQGDILLRQELWTDNGGYLLKVWVSPTSPIFWFLIPIAITAMGGAVMSWKISDLMPKHSIGSMLVIGAIAVAALAGGVYLLAKR